MGVDLDGDDSGVGIQVGDGKGLATGGGATIQHVLAARTNQGGDQLRGLVLNYCVEATKGLCLGDIA
jgi:hypothetical protein